MRNFYHALLILFLGGAAFCATENVKTVNQTVTDSQFTLHEPAFEMGGGLGTPAWANLVLGFHFPMGSRISGFVRVSGMYHGADRTGGSDLDLGVYFDTTLPFIQSAGLHFGYNNIYDEPRSYTGQRFNWYYGVVYEFNLKGFYLKGGLALPGDSRVKTSNSSSFLVPLVQAGYTVFFNL